MRVNELIQAVQQLTRHRYTKKELAQIHETINEVQSNIGQSKWAIEDEIERDELQELVINKALVEYYKSGS